MTTNGRDMGGLLRAAGFTPAVLGRPNTAGVNPAARRRPPMSRPFVVIADVLLPPTFVADSLYLGFPVGPIVGLALAAAAVGGFLVLVRKRVPMWLAALICA